MRDFNQGRVATNLHLIKQLKAGRATPDALKKYSGWGGLREAFYQPATYRLLKELLTVEELNGIKRTFRSAYYTPVALVKFIYDYLDCSGFKGGRILEPAIGNGIFMEHMLQSWQAACQVEAVELDNLTSQITQQLYPNITLHNMPFETFQPTAHYDLIIGNPPYGAMKVKDNHHADLSSYCIHHYFVAKSMRLLKKGGLLAMVLPSYFLDNETQHVRHLVQQEGGQLLAAYRLPDDCFSDAKVTVDVVFLQKSGEGKAWATVKPVQVGNLSQPLNEYYHQHSHHILGNLEIIDMYQRKGLTCKTRGSINTLLAVEIERVRNQVIAQRFEQGEQGKQLLQRIQQQHVELEALKTHVLAWQSK